MEINLIHALCVLIQEMILHGIGCFILVSKGYEANWRRDRSGVFLTNIYGPLNEGFSNYAFVPLIYSNTIIETT